MPEKTETEIVSPPENSRIHIKGTWQVSVGEPVSLITISGMGKVTVGKQTKLLVIVSPRSAANKSVTWSSSDQNTAAVNAGNGIVTGKKLGKAIITAAANDGSSVKGVWEITVESAIPSVAMNGPHGVAVGKTIKLGAKVTPADGADKEVLWSSSDPNIAYVTPDGVVEGREAGITTISAAIKIDANLLTSENEKRNLQTPDMGRGPGEVVIKVTDLKKIYQRGTYGGGTLQGQLQSWWALKHRKEDPNSKINANNLERKFLALDGINLEIRKGERLGIIGANGAGKSTLLKILSRITAPTEGEVMYKGRIASMLQVGAGFHPELTGRENIYLNGAILGMKKSEIDAKIQNIIDFSECQDFIETPVKRYSSGMYVRLAFSVSAFLDAEIMLMDEVLAVGDEMFRNKCLSKMTSLVQDQGRTIIFVSHGMDQIRDFCDRCIVLKKGKIIFDGDVDQAIDIYSSGT